MSRQLKFYGASDDLFEIEGTKGKEPDEVGCYNKPAVAKIKSKEGSLCIVGMYAPANAAACWSIGLMPADEGVAIPDWPMKWGLSDRGYSPELKIDVPDDAVVSMVK